MHLKNKLKGDITIWTLIAVAIVLIGIVVASLIATGVLEFGEEATTGVTSFLLDVI